MRVCPSVVTDKTGGAIGEYVYRPFGETYFEAGTHFRYLYTGQEHDFETGLYFYNARYYDARLARFISADTIVPGAFDPQALNRYTYVRNNPIIYTDPSGHCPLCIAILIGAAVGTVSAGIQSDWDGDAMLQGALTGAVSGAVFYGAGSLIESFNVISNVAQAGIHVGAGALSGGINAGITGGDVGMAMATGGISGGIAKYAGGYLPDNFAAQFAGRTVIGGITGGITTEMYGGDFGEGFISGATTGAIGYIANDLLHKGFMKLLEKMENKSVMKTMKSLEKNIVEHEAALKDPSQALSVSHHEHELRLFRAQLDLAQGEAARRGLLGAGFAEGISSGEASGRTDNWFDWFDPNFGVGYAY